jgi:DNA-binding IscR family transcriptional regulator
MAQSGRFELGLRVLALLATQPNMMMTSATIAEALGESPVMVRRLFPPLHDAGLILQKKGPSGGAKLSVAPKSIGLGDVFAAIEPGWLETDEKNLNGSMRRVRVDAIDAMNETNVASIAKKLNRA